MEKIRVVLADDHALLRAGIRALLRELPDIEVVGEAVDGEEALAQVDAQHPDVVLMDIAMPKLSGLDATAQLQQTHPDVKVVVLTMHKDHAYIRRAVLSGACGYLLKESDLDELGLAIRAAARGETYLSPAVSTHVIADYRRQAEDETPQKDALTHRQREVLRLIACGRSTKAIARELGVSTKTVETHRSQLMERLQIHDLAGLVRYAVRVGLVSADI